MRSHLPEHDRDFRGYAGRPPAVRWPRGSRLAVSIVVEVEDGTEPSMGEPLQGGRDLGLESHFEYGLRAGWPRVRALLKSYGVPATLHASAGVVAFAPWLAKEAITDGHEIAAQGWTTERHGPANEAEERAAIVSTLEAVQEAAGVAPLGWHTRAAPSVNTRRLLAEHGGLLYDSNADNDDLPYLIEAAGRPHVVLPYASDTNDMRFETGGFVSGEDFSRYAIEAFDRLYEEGARAPRMLSIGLHPRIIGRPGRIGGLERFLAHAAARSGTWFARRDTIARHWLNLVPAYEGPR